MYVSVCNILVIHSLHITTCRYRKWQRSYQRNYNARGQNQILIRKYQRRNMKNANWVLTKFKSFIHHSVIRHVNVMILRDLKKKNQKRNNPRKYYTFFRDYYTFYTNDRYDKLMACDTAFIYLFTYLPWKDTYMYTHVYVHLECNGIKLQNSI